MYVNVRQAILIQCQNCVIGNNMKQRKCEDKTHVNANQPTVKNASQMHSPKNIPYFRRLMKKTTNQTHFSTVILVI